MQVGPGDTKLLLKEMTSSLKEMASSLLLRDILFYFVQPKILFKQWQLARDIPQSLL